MVLARKESIYEHEQIKGQESRVSKAPKKRKSYRLEKFLIVAIIAAIFAFSILILTRFMAIAEVRYRVNKLEKQLEELEIEKVKLKIDLEKVSQSGWVEDEAKDRLQMDYPAPEQIVHININPAKVAMLTNEMEQFKNNGLNKEGKDKKLINFFGKLISYIRI